jgi:hypothetical protein
MEPHGFLSGKCKHGSSNFCILCDIEGHPERYVIELLEDVITEVKENQVQPLSSSLQKKLMAYVSRPTQRAADGPWTCATNPNHLNAAGREICGVCGAPRG